MIKAYVVKAIKIVPLFILMSQKEILHLLSAEVDLVLIVAFDCFSLIHRIIQGHQELLKALHYRRGRTQIHVMNVTKPCLNGDTMMRLHEVQVRVAPVLWWAIAGPSSASIT